MSWNLAISQSNWKYHPKSVPGQWAQEANVWLLWHLNAKWLVLSYSAFNVASDDSLPSACRKNVTTLIENEANVQNLSK